MSNTILGGLDFETYCALDLKEVGLARYVAHPTFITTLASVALPNSQTVCVEFPHENPTALAALIKNKRWVFSAHNAGFESAVLRWMGIKPANPLIDSAVVAAVAGADRHLAGAARQLMHVDKLDGDQGLVNLFAKKQRDQVSDEFDRNLIKRYPEKWQQYKDYCNRDAELSRGLVIDWGGDPDLFKKEMLFAQITLEMNEAGWPVDVASVEEMRKRYLANLEQIQYEFAFNVDANLNINSHVQVKKWCEDRGIRSNSFDKQNVERLINRLNKLEQSRGSLTPEYGEVRELLRVKQELGGSSLKKLDTILAVVHNGRAYDQYVHAGAGQSLRTSGRSIQMQNLPRLANQRGMAQLHMPTEVWTNDELTGNLRQVFTSSHPQGRLIVADFASIESRALAYLAGETWKVEAYRRGEDVYKAQAVKIFKLNGIDEVDKAQRTTGKVGELSCGYGAGPVAVKDFAAKMHVELSESEAGTLVRDWRDVCPCTVDFWYRLGNAMAEAVQKDQVTRVSAAHSMMVKFQPTATPASLLDQAPDVKSFRMELWNYGILRLSRVFHGCYMRGQNIGYHKPSSLKGGHAWKKTYTDPKTKRQRYYELYGGKLAGILTQSLCREIFFDALVEIRQQLASMPNATLIGQFHDEVVIDWVPGDTPMDQVMSMLKDVMSYSSVHPRLPMGVEVKHDYRYTK